MAGQATATQSIIPYTEVNVAQINAALVAHSGSQTIVDGLNALKTAILGGISDAAACVECNATGKIDKDSTGATINAICPLCGGNTKTAGQYKINNQIISYDPVP